MNEFPQDWQTEPLDVCLDDILDYRGKSVPKSESGVRLLTARNVRDGVIDFSHSEFIPEEMYIDWMDRGIPHAGDILFTTEAPLGMVAPYPENGKFALGQRLVALRSNEQRLHSGFLLYYLLSTKGKRRVITLATGTTALGIRQSELRKVDIPLPPLPEQRKIAEILGTWDEAIAATEELLASLEGRKQGLMQRLLIVPQHRNEPLNRLSGFREKWAKKPLGEVFQRVTRKNGETGNRNVLTASAQHGLVSQTEYFNRIVASDNLEGYYLLLKGEFAYNKSSSDGYPFGAIKRLDLYEAGVLSTLYICFRLADQLSDGTFYKHFFEAGGMNRGIYTVAQEGARNHGLLNIGLSDFFGLDVPVPSLAEQTQLAEFFELQDRQIETAKKHLEQLEIQKKGLMQRLLTGQVRVAG